MDPSETFTVSRARPADAEAIADFVTRSTRGRISVVPESVVERSGTKGLWLVSDTTQQIVGLAGWRAENLIARIDDFLVFPFELYESAGRALLASIENAAQELRCEVSILLVPCVLPKEWWIFTKTVATCAPKQKNCRASGRKQLKKPRSKIGASCSSNCVRIL